MAIVSKALNLIETCKHFFPKLGFLIILVLLPLSLKANNGVPDDNNEFPAVGAYYQFATIGTDIEFVGESCSGTLISPNLLMTAAHCTFFDTRLLIETPGYSFEEWVTFDVYATDNDFICFLRDINYPGTSSLTCDRSSRNFPKFHETGSGSSLITHPNYSTVREKGNGELILTEPFLGIAPDFGILYLNKPIKRIAPMPLAPIGFLDDKQSFIGMPVVEVGYGMNETKFIPPKPTGTGGPTTTTGLTGIKQVANIGTIRSIGDSSITPTQSSAHGEDVVCYGDSGSPIFLVENGVVTKAVLGVLSGWANWCIGAFDPFSRVDTPEVMDFIDCVRAAPNGKTACACGIEGQLGLCDHF